MTRTAIASDLGLPDPALEAARCLARTWLQAELWGQPLPPLSPLAAQAVQQLRQEALGRQAVLRAKHAARNEEQRQRDLRAQRERD